MPVLFKRNSLSSMGGGGGVGDNGQTTATAGAAGTQRPHGTKRPPEPTESERLLAGRHETQAVKVKERQRREEFKLKILAVTMIQRSWRRYKSQKGKSTIAQQLQQFTKNEIHKKRVRSSQEEWERQIAALTIQLAWRKYYRKKLLKALNPNRRQLQMWDPEVIALKQQALLHYIYNERIQAPFWHPTLKRPTRPLWLKFVPSPAAVSYNFAVDQYVPWISSLVGQGQGQLPWPQLEEEMAAMQAQSSQNERQQQRSANHNSSASVSARSSDVKSSDSRRVSKTSKDSQRPRTTVPAGKRSETHSSRNGRTRKL